MTTLNDIPSAECPHCGVAFQWDDYYEMEAGDTRECPQCEKVIYVTGVDTIIQATLSTEWPEGGAR